jgi:transcriptional regulator with XRE-family HTH domain
MVTLEEALKIRIDQLCKQKNISILKLSRLSNVNQSTLNEFMQGRTKFPSINTILKIANGFNMTLSEFFNADIFEQVSINDKNV